MATPALGALHPGVRFPRQLRYKSRLLFHWRAADAFLGHDPAAHLLKPVTGETPTFSRASAGGLTLDSRGRLRPWAQGIPRLDYVDLDGDGIYETPGLLLEGARTNLALRSQEFDNGSWSKQQATATPNVAVAPDGSTTADRLTEDSTPASIHQMFQSITIGAGNTVVFSLYCKADTRTKVRVRADSNSGANGFYYNFDLATGAEISATAFGTGALISRTFRALPNGWYRLTVVGTVDAAATACTVGAMLLDAAGLTIYNGDGASGLYVWGAQAEVNVNFASSYIPTVASSVARSTDALDYPALSIPLRDVTLYLRVAHTGWGSAGAINVPASLFTINAATGSGRFQRTTGFNSVLVRVGGTSFNNSPGLNPGVGGFESVVQLVDVASAVKGRIDVGSGFSAFSATGGPMTGPFTSIQIGASSALATEPAFATIREAKIAAGAYTLEQMRRLF